jgi:uncharacterized protein YecT (DUF1311 family)
MADKPRQQHERRAAALALASRLSASNRRTKGDKEDLDLLIMEELRVMDWAENAAARSNNPTYQANMQTAQNTAQEACDLLNAAKRAFIGKRNNDAAELLFRVSKLGSKATKNPATNISKLYMEYLAVSDTDFHAWLLANGHKDALDTLSVATRTSSRHTEGA